MQKKMMRYAAALLTWCAVSVGWGGVSACATEPAPGSGQVDVVYEVQAAEDYPLTLSASGNGQIQYKDKTQNQDIVIREKEEDFLLKAGDKVVLLLQPDQDEKIVSVVWNGTNITDQVKDGKIEIVGEEKEQKLVVVFSVTEKPAPPVPPKPVEPSKPEPPKPEPPAPPAPQKPDNNTPPAPPAPTKPTPPPTVTPQTGDSSNLALYLVLMVGSFIGLLAFAPWKKRSKKKNEGRMI